MSTAMDILIISSIRGLKARYLIKASCTWTPCQLCWVPWELAKSIKGQSLYHLDSWLCQFLDRASVSKLLSSCLFFKIPDAGKKADTQGESAEAEPVDATTNGAAAQEWGFLQFWYLSVLVHKFFKDP